MPSWCVNTIKIRGKSEDIYKFFKRHIIDYSFDFNTIIPEPENESECDERFKRNSENSMLQVSKGREWFDWYEWRRYHWDTKWNAKKTKCENVPAPDKKIEDYSETSCKIIFYTAWSSPRTILDWILENYPDLHIEIYLFYEMTGQYLFYGENKGYDDDDYKSIWESDESQELDKFNKEYNIIKKNDRVIVFKEDCDWSEVAIESCKNIVSEKSACQIDKLEDMPDAILYDSLSALFPPLFHRELLKFADSNLKENGNMLLKVDLEEAEEIETMLQDKFREIKRFEAPSHYDFYIIALGKI